MTQDFRYAVVSKLELEANLKIGRSRIKEITVEIVAQDEIQDQWREEDGALNADGLKAQTQGLIQGLVNSIHYGHQKGLRDSAEHLRYIIENLQKGFVQQVTVSDFPSKETYASGRLKRNRSNRKRKR